MRTLSIQYREAGFRKEKEKRKARPRFQTHIGPKSRQRDLRERGGLRVGECQARLGMRGWGKGNRSSEKIH